MDKSLIAEAVKSLEVKDIYVNSCSVERHVDITDSDFPEEMFQQASLGISAEFWEPTEENPQKEKIIKVKVDLGLRFVAGEDDELIVLAEIKACFVAEYIQTGEASQEALDEFIQFNTVHNVWPFWREHAFRVSAETRLPRPQIGLYKKHQE